MRLIRLLLALTCCAAATQASPRTGSLTGRVTAADGTPLAGAHLSLIAGAQGATTDAQGRYLLPAVPAGAGQLLVSFIGYRTVERTFELTAGERLRLDFELEESLLPMEGTIVTARGGSSPLRALAGSAGMVEAGEIARINPLSIAEALRAVPGVWQGSDMPWSSHVQIRGLSRDNLVFLIDGNRVSTTSEIAAQFGMVAPADVERVELLKGPISVLYGTGSIGGVVNAIPRSGRFTPHPQWNWATGAAYESVADGVSGYARLEFNAPRFYALFSQSYRDYDSYTAGGGALIPNSQFRDYQSHLNLGVQPVSAHTLDFRYQWFTARNVGIPGAGGVFPPAATVRYPQTGRWLAQATWRYQPSWAGWRQSELRLFAQTIERRAEVQPNQVNYQPASETQPLRRVRPQSIEPTADHQTTGFRWHNLIALAGHDLVFGMEGWQKELSSRRRRVTQIDILRPDSTVVETREMITEDRSLPTSTYRPLGFYLQDQFDLTRRLTLSAGFRFDLIQIRSRTTYRSYQPPSDQVLWPASRDTDISWSAQSRLSYALRPGLDLHLALARSFRSPGLEERFLYVDLGHTVRLGDPALDSEYGRFWESGISARTDRLQWNAQVFYNHISNLVVEEPALFEGRNALVKRNVGNALLMGGESGLAVVFQSRLLVSADVAYVRGDDRKDHHPLPAIAPLTSRLSIRYGNRRWAQADLTLTASQRRTAPGELPTDGYTTLDLSTGYDRGRILGVSHRLTVGLRNLLDAGYRDHLSTSRGFPLNAPGRSLFVTWSAEQ